MRLYNVLPARGVVRDFTLIEDFLFKTYRDLGDDPEEAGGRAAARIKAARAYMRTFEGIPIGAPNILRSGRVCAQ